jgi:hypothetical protein
MTKLPVPFLMDVPALYSWAEAAGNESKAVLEEIQSGNILVFNRVWDSFNNAYPDECATLPKESFKRARCSEEHRLAAAEIAEDLNAMFPLRGGYDDAIEWTVVGIAKSGPYTIVTDARRKEKYSQVDGLYVITYEELLDEI